MVVLSDRAPRLRSALKEYKLALNKILHDVQSDFPEFVFFCSIQDTKNKSSSSLYMSRSDRLRSVSF